MPIVGGRFCLENLKYFKGILTVKRLGRFSFCFFFLFFFIPQIVSAKCKILTACYIDMFLFLKFLILRGVLLFLPLTNIVLIYIAPSY